MTLLLKACLGALVVILINFLSRTKSFYIAGLIPLFPAFALIAHYTIGTRGSVHDLRTTLVFGMWSLIPYFIYLMTAYMLIGRMPLTSALSSGVALWVVGACILLSIWKRVFP
jgi:membrane protein GlpM